MKLTQDQCDSLDRDGFLILPDRFTVAEVERMRARLPDLFSEQHPGNIVEQSSGEVRTTMGLHLRDEVFARVVRHPRLVAPALQVLGEDAYVQQVKVNVKAAFSGEIWQWHYDFATHHQEDGVPHPRALNLHIFLDDVTQFNGPLYFIPGSHKSGDHGAYLDDETTSYPLWVCDADHVRELARERGLVAAEGGKGTMLIFHDTLVHGSPNNMSPWDRAIFSLILNPVSNALRNPTRPDYKHHRDLSPVAPPGRRLSRPRVGGRVVPPTMRSQCVPALDLAGEFLNSQRAARIACAPRLAQSASHRVIDHVDGE